jgi:hypothetical protein
MKLENDLKLVLERSVSQQCGKVSCGDNCVYQKHKTDSSIFLKTHFTNSNFDSELWENILDRKRSFENLLRDIKDDFNNWRKENCEVSETFRFWDTFIHTDFML